MTKRKFTVLKLISDILKILAIIAAVFTVLGALVAVIVSFAGGSLFTSMGLRAGDGLLAGLAAAFFVFLIGALYTLVLFGYGEMISLAIAVEENTDKTAQLLEKIAPKDPPAA